jgi:hypothetical protein
LSATITSAAIASPFHELARAVHGGVEICFSLHASAFAARAVGIEHPGVHVGIDRHLLPGHRVERKAGGDFSDALGAARDHDELDRDEDRENDQPDDDVAAHHERAERRDDRAHAVRQMALCKDEARRAYVQR